MKPHEPKVLHEWHFLHYTGRIVETEPGIVQFLERKQRHGEDSPTEFRQTDKPMGTANEILCLVEEVKELKERAMRCRCSSPNLLAEILATPDDETEYTEWMILHARLKQYLRGTGPRGLANLLGTVTQLRDRLEEIGLAMSPTEPGDDTAPSEAALSDPSLCKFCGLDVYGPGDVCMGCEVVVEEGRTARRRMAQMESCPWLTAHHELVDVYGDPAHHDDVPPGERGSCPWCSGWAEVERDLFDAARGAQ